jgi:hypothetical protein
MIFEGSLSAVLTLFASITVADTEQLEELSIVNINWCPSARSSSSAKAVLRSGGVLWEI